MWWINEYQRIALYPKRLHLAGYALLYAVAGSIGIGMSLPFLSALLPPYSLAHLPLQVVAALVGALVLLTGLMLLTLLPFTLYRLFVRKPSLIVSEDGVFDGCSLVAGGIGLLRWDEIRAIMPNVLRKRVAFIVIIPRDAERVLARQGPVARFWRRVLNLTQPHAISLPQWLLAAPVPEVYDRITAEYGDIMRAQGVFIVEPAVGHAN